jgi:hypothetical protein
LIVSIFYQMIEFEKYTKKEIALRNGMVNMMALVTTLPFIIILALPFFILWGTNFEKPFIHYSYGLKMGIIIGSIILGLLVHELIHGITWSIFLKKGFRSIKFGVIWKILTPYCHSKEPLKVWQYMLGAILPGFILGILPALASWVTGNIFLLIYGLIFTLAAGGDLTIIWLIRNENKKDWVIDHPEKVGCFIFSKNNH